MPRRKKKESAGANTYHKAKNGRFYKKVTVDGKTRVRFVSNAEATGAMKPSKTSKSSKPKPSKPSRSRARARKKTMVPETSDAESVEA